MVFRNRDNENQNNENPPIVFANINRPSSELLTFRGYKIFSILTSILWCIPLIIITSLEIEISINQNVILAIAGSSVELSALSLALLGILSELNKKDRWFKVGLLLISTIFVITTLGGFYSSYVWKDVYSLPQTVTVVLIFIIGIGWIFQFVTWLIDRTKKWTENRRFDTWKTFIASFPFILPLVFIFPINGNLPSRIAIIFVGGIIALIILLAVTTIISLFADKIEEDEDEFLKVLKQRYSTEIQEIVRIGELKSHIHQAMIEIQTDRQNQVSEKVELIHIDEITTNLRGKNIVDDNESISQTLQFMVQDRTISEYHYPYFWLIPSVTETDNWLSLLDRWIIFITDVVTDNKNSLNKKTMMGLKFEKTLEHLLKEVKIPSEVLYEFVISKFINRLKTEYELHTTSYKFVNIQVCHIYIIKHEQRLISAIYQSSSTEPEGFNDLIEQGYIFEDGWDKPKHIYDRIEIYVSNKLKDEPS